MFLNSLTLFKLQGLIFVGFLGAFAKFRKSSSRLSSDCLTGKLGSHWTGFHDIWYLSIFRKSVEKIQVSFKSDKNTGHFTLSQYTFLIYLAHFFLKLKKCFERNSRENQNTHFMFNNFFFFRKSRRLWDVRKCCRAGQATETIWCVRVACCMPRASDSHSGCVIVIGVALQQWMHENASMLRHTCIANLVKHIKGFLSFLFYFSKF
jgi:hypothetical protein